MVKAKLSTELIIKQIQSASLVDFDCSPQALIDLHNAGIDERISLAMMARSKELEQKGTSNRSESSTVKDEPPNSKETSKKQVLKKMGFTFTDFCKTSGNTIVCEVMVSTSQDDKQLGFGWASKSSTAVDESGIVHEESRSQLGNKTSGAMESFANDVAVRGRIAFEGTKQEPSSLKLLHLSFNTLGISGKENFKVDFRDVPVVQN